MKRAFVCLMFSQVVCAIVAATASAQFGVSPFPCASASVQIESARYLGKNAGKDSVEVRWRIQGGTGANTPLGQPAGGIGGGGLNGGIGGGGLGGGGLGGGGFNGGGAGGVTPEIVCFAGIAPTIQGTFKVDVKIKRRLGNEDSASTTVSGRLTDPFVTVVRIDRGTVETDPQSFQISVTNSNVVSGNASFTTSFKGLGAPSLTTTLTATTDPSNVSSICVPSLSLTQVTFTPGSGAVKDKVTFAWTTTTPAQTPCIGLRNPTASATVTRTNGSSGSGSASLASTTTTNATIELSGTPAAVSNFELRVAAKMALPPIVIGRGDLQGNF